MIELKRIVLCADDFGLNKAVSLGVLRLTQLNRLTAVSCMVNMPLFDEMAHALLLMRDQVQIGLHFNLTEGHWISKPERQAYGLNELIIKSHLRCVSSRQIYHEFNAQLDQFIQTMGFFPAFVDGHQHVHQFPLVRQVILETYEQRLRPNQVYIRSIYPLINLPRYHMKGRILAHTGGQSLLKELIRFQIPHNQFFSGVYDFNPQTDYKFLFRKWLALSPSNTLVMCHPALYPSEDDPISTARVKEYEYLESDEFLFDVLEMGCRLSKFGD